MSIDLTGLEASATALIRTVDALGAEELAAPSLLPGWTRGHVVAHLALNGEALAGVMEAVLHEEPVAMYESNERRDADIEELAQAQQADLFDRLLASVTKFQEAALAMDDPAWQGTFSRTPGAPAQPVADAPLMRRREVEIHHADLGAVYSRTDWPEDFLIELLDGESAFYSDGAAFTLRATDLDRTWQVGATGGPTVSGLGADLGWWLTGRGAESLSCDGGELPRLGPWQRASATAGPTPEK